MPVWLVPPNSPLGKGAPSSARARSTAAHNAQSCCERVTPAKAEAVRCTCGPGKIELSASKIPTAPRYTSVVRPLRLANTQHTRRPPPSCPVRKIPRASLRPLTRSAASKLFVESTTIVLAGPPPRASLDGASPVASTDGDGPARTGQRQANFVLGMAGGRIQLADTRTRRHHHSLTNDGDS